jgi:hypothetical protein
LRSLFEEEEVIERQEWEGRKIQASFQSSIEPGKGELWIYSRSRRSPKEL